MPDPFHPAVVHFPVVLLLLGAVTALVAVIWRQSCLPLLAAVFLALGAIGAWVAVETGEADGGLLEGHSSELESLVESHENWAKRVLAAASVTAAVAFGSLILRGFPRVGRAVAVLAAVGASLTGYAVYETGRRGGELVFTHGVGVDAVSVIAAPGLPQLEGATQRPSEGQNVGRE